MIYLVRHGQTEWNLLNKFNGITETELNETGINQAHILKEDINKLNLDLCFSSPQKRASQTCKIIYKGIGILDNRLSEIDCGEFEGMTETFESTKLFWKAVMCGDKGTESFHHFIKRNCDFCSMISTEFIGKNILIITHAANARVINYYFSGKPSDYDFRTPVAGNGEILRFEN